MLYRVWLNPLFRTVLGIYTLGMAWCVVNFHYLYIVTNYWLQGIASLGSLFLISWLIVKFAEQGAKRGASLYIDE